MTRQPFAPPEPTIRNPHLHPAGEEPASGTLPLREFTTQAAKPPGYEAVDHPTHYHPGTYEAIKVIEAWGLGFCLGNTVKYIARAGHKPAAAEVEDLEKAQWYLTRRIMQLRGQA